MNQALIAAIALSALVVTLIALAILAVTRKKRKEYASNETEKFLSKEIEINEIPAPGTKVASVQPIYRTDTQEKPDITDEIDDSCGYLYFTIKYEDERSVLIVKLIKGENIPTQKSFPSQPYVEIQILPVKAEPINGPDGIEFQIMPENLVRQTVHFCIYRYDTFSRKTTIGDVFLSLAELTAEKEDLNQEIFIKNLIKPNLEIGLWHRNAKDLWDKVRKAVLAGELRRFKRRSFVEPLTWEVEAIDLANFGDPEEGERNTETKKQERRKSVKVKGPRGTLFFSLKYDAKRSLLLTRIMRAEHIPDHDGKTPNVFVECALLPGQESESPCSTTLQQSTFAPVFEETFKFNVDFEELWKKKLHLIVWYVDQYSHLTCLGEVVHSLGQLDIEGFDISETEMLFSKEIMLLYHTKDVKENSSSILFSLTYLPATNRLGVLILKAKDLKTKQNGRGVYVEVTILHRNMRHRKVTSFKTGTHNPLFNEALLFDLKDFLINEVKLQTTVFQKAPIGSDIPLGRVVLANGVGGSEESHWLETLTAAKPTAQWHQLQPCPAVVQPVHGITTVKTKEIRTFQVPKSRR